MSNTKVRCQTKYKSQSRWWRTIWMSLKLLTNSENVRGFQSCIEKKIVVKKDFWKELSVFCESKRKEKEKEKAWKLSLSVDSVHHFIICLQSDDHQSATRALHAYPLNKALNLDTLCWTEGLKERPCPFTKEN